MQGSFWKSVAVVGVIGIGSLAILEVQRSISDGAAKEAQAEADAAVLASQTTGPGEKTVDATLQTSEFERLLSGEQDDTPQFDLTEPPVSSEESPFYDSPVAAQENMPVDTRVSAENLASGNPFAREEAEAVTAGYSEEPGQQENVQPVGFEDQDSPAFDQGSAGGSGAGNPTQNQSRPFLEDNGTSEPAFKPGKAVDTRSAAASPDDNPAFPLFGQEEPAPADAPPITSGESNVPTAAGNGAQRESPMLFIGSGNETTETETPPEQNAAGQQTFRTAQADGQQPPLRPTPESDQPAPFEEDPVPAPEQEDPASAPAFDNQFGQPFPESNSPEPEPETGTNEFPSFDDPGPSFDPPPRTEPRPVPAESRETSDESRPFAEDLVPVPREAGQPDFGDSAPGTGDGNPDSSTGRPASNADPAPFEDGAAPRAAEDEPSTLPFVEDMEPADNPGETPDFGRPDFGREDAAGQPPSLSIPSNGGLQPTPAPGSGFNMPPREDFEGADGFGSPFDRGQEDLQNDSPRPFPTSPGPAREDFGGNNFNSESDLTYPEVRPRQRRPPQGDAVRTVAGLMRPNLVLQKSAPENATVGTPIQYNILVRNEGDATAYDVVVEDEVTPAARVNGVHPQSEIDRRSNKLVWRFDQIDPGEDQTITVEVVPTGEGTMDGVATVRFKTRVKATTVVTAPRLEIRMRGPNEVRLGDEVRYSYVITNRGSGEARDVYVRTVLPESGGLRHPAGNDLEYRIDALKPNEQREISLSVIAGEPGEYRAEAEVTASGGAKSQASWRTKIAGAQLKIVRRGPRKRFVNREGTYENIISNESNFDARDARVVEQIPPGMKFIDATRGGRYDPSTRTVTWNINQIGPNQVETLQIRLMPTTAGSAESTVTIYENVGLQSSEVSTTVVEDLHNVSADISQLDGPVALGDTFGFTIAVDNRGTADATDVSLTVEVPDAIQVVGAGSREVEARLLEGNIVQYNVVVRIPPNQQKDFELKLKGVREVQNALVKASVRYTQMEKPLVVSESVTIYESL